ncbi:MAG: hypothetical protein WC428_00980 [Candidatus Paceibacterota bacterium]
MIEIEITESKYRRTYIGGSKKKEKEIFLNVQGTKEDNSDCDWLEYRRLLKTYLDDVITVLSSWKGLCLRESYAFLFIAALYMKTQLLFYLFICIAILFQIGYFIFKKKEKNSLRAYKLTQTILLSEIKKIMGLDLDKI